MDSHVRHPFPSPIGPPVCFRCIGLANEVFVFIMKVAVGLVIRCTRRYFSLVITRAQTILWSLSMRRPFRIRRRFYLGGPCIGGRRLRGRLNGVVTDWEGMDGLAIELAVRDLIETSIRDRVGVG
jgi:hypothetical protein